MSQDMAIMMLRMSQTQDSASLGLALPDPTMPRGDSDSSNEYNEETDTGCPLPELQEQL